MGTQANDKLRVGTMDMQDINRRVIEQFRAGGEIEGMQRERLLLLTTKGAKTGADRTTPTMFHADGDRVVVMASNAGASKAPSWYANLCANPSVYVEIGDEAYSATATVADGEERARLWSEITSLYPFFLEHEQTANREIPLVVLTREQPAT
jgi:deazaflavin-dependent oxidoreductase (nitroreductase family)